MFSDCAPLLCLRYSSCSYSFFGGVAVEDLEQGVVASKLSACSQVGERFSLRLLFAEWRF